MVERPIVIAAGAVVCVCLGIRLMRASRAGAVARRALLGELGRRTALLAATLAGVGLFDGVLSKPVFAAVAVTGLLIIVALPLAPGLLPFLLVAAGLAGLSLDLGRSGAGAWIAALLLLDCGFLAAGLWLYWHATDHRSRLGRAAARWERRWGLVLLPPVAGVLFVLFSPWYEAGLAAAMAVAAVLTLGLVITSRGAAADLATAGLVLLGAYVIAFAVHPPPALGGAIAQLDPYPYAGFPRSAAGLAAVQGTAILALGLWLAPRTIGAHAKRLLRPEPDAELADRVEQLTQTRADAVDGAAAELRRVERDLHDGAQARLVALGMNLRAAERLIPTSPQAAIALVAEAREASSRALNELRDLVRGIYPPVLADRGLADAVRALALDTPLLIETDIELPGRLDAPVESACYFAVAEALVNAVKHSGARMAHVRIRHSAKPPALGARFRPTLPGMLRIEVTDNGSGGADPARGGGLAGIERRLGTFDGILAVSSPPGGPTMIVMEVPCALSSPRTSSC